jgi:hypothetical protein
MRELPTPASVPVTVAQLRVTGLAARTGARHCTVRELIAPASVLVAQLLLSKAT